MNANKNQKKFVASFFQPDHKWVKKSKQNVLNDKKKTFARFGNKMLSSLYLTFISSFLESAVPLWLPNLKRNCASASPHRLVIYVTKKDFFSPFFVTITPKKFKKPIEVNLTELDQFE